MRGPKPKRSLSFSESDYGLIWFELLATFGLTPGEWGAMRRDRRLFLEQAYLNYREEYGSLLQNGL